MLASKQVYKEQPIAVKLETNMLEKPINRDTLKSASFQMRDTENWMKQVKLDPDELKNYLFDLFTQTPKMSFDDIQKELSQPRVSQILF